MRIQHVRSIAGRGLGPAYFSNELRAVHIDRRGRLWAAGDSEVKQFDAEGRLVQRWATSRPALCVVGDAQDRLWLGFDGGIEIRDVEGSELEAWSDADRLGRVTSIGFAGGAILLADATHRCIRRYGHDLRFIGDIGAANNTRGFLVPNGHLEFGVDDDGVIRAANPGKYRIERYTVEGRPLGHFGRFGTRDPAAFPGCCNPTNMALLPGGRVAVTEKAPPRLKLYEPDGRLLGLVGPEAFDPNCRNMDVAVDAGGRIFVADTIRLRILVFGCDREAAETVPASGGTPDEREPLAGVRGSAGPLTSQPSGGTRP